jgi:hypothetical protein
MSNFVKWAFPRVLVLAVLVSIVWLALRVEGVLWDACVETNTRTYCTIQHPLGAHR